MLKQPAQANTKWPC